MKMEGRFEKHGNKIGYFYYHIGGDAAKKVFSMILPDTIEVEDHGITSIHIKANALAVFGITGNTSTKVLNLQTLSSFHSTASALEVASNYHAAMFKVDHVHNAHSH